MHRSSYDHLMMSYLRHCNLPLRHKALMQAFLFGSSDDQVEGRRGNSCCADVLEGAEK